MYLVNAFKKSKFRSTHIFTLLKVKETHMKTSLDNIIIVCKGRLEQLKNGYSSIALFH